MSCLRRFVLVALFAGSGAVAGCTTSDPAPAGGSGGTSGPAGSGGSAGAGGSGGSAGSGGGGAMGSGGGQGTDASADTGRPDGNVVDRSADTSPAVDAPVMPASPKLSADIAPFIKMKCAIAGCHDPIKKEHGMDMSTAALVYAAWVNRMTADHCANDLAVTRVVPSKPADSFLLKMVENIGRCSEMPRMPPAPRAALTAMEIKAIRDWITAGARND